MKPPEAHTPLSLAKAADYWIRRMPSGGAVEVLYPWGRVLELGPDATDDEIIRHARRHLAGPIAVRPPDNDVTPISTADGKLETG